MSKRLRGVDVSTYQGVLTPAIGEALQKEGCDFAYCRCIVGNEKKLDDRFLANIELFNSIGIACGGYLFPYPLPHLDPIAQAEAHVAALETVGTTYGEMAPMIDAEWPPRETKLKDGSIEQTWKKFGCSAPQIREWILKYAARVDELTGCTSPFYSYRYWIACIEAAKAPELGDRPLVLADYSFTGRVPDDAACAALKVPGPWSKVTIWQHDGDGGLRLPVPGGNDVDWNVMPNPEDLSRLLGQPKDPAPLPNELPDLASVALAGSMGGMMDDMIAEYRRSRIDEAA